MALIEQAFLMLVIGSMITFIAGLAYVTLTDRNTSSLPPAE